MAILFHLSFVFENCLYADERVCFLAAGLERENHAMRIPGALKLYDFSVHRQGDILLFTLDLKTFVALRRELVSRLQDKSTKILRYVFLQH